MARPKKPTALKILQGTARPDRANPHEPEYAPLDLEPPHYLTADERREYLRLCGMMRSAGVMTVADVDALVMYVRAWRRWRAAHDVLIEQGETHDTPGGLRARPEVKIARDAQIELVRLMTEFGLTPASRAKVSSAGKKDDTDKKGFGGIRR